MRIRLLFALSGRSGSSCHRRFGVVQTRTGDGSGAHRSAHGFWQGPTADLPDADRDNNRPQHIPPSTLRARLQMAVHEADTFARATQPLVERRVNQTKTTIVAMPIVSYLWTRCIYTRRAQRSQRNYSQRSLSLKNGVGLLAASCESGRIQPHPFHHRPPIRAQDVAPCRRRSIRSFKLPEEIVERGNGAYLLTTLDCGTAKHRHHRFGPAM
ncbi:selenocysteine-tRNA-specific elongation factor [Trypanosoma cruzi]|nr:selenocysteine-tRNA-specific elongation factor [Trypanosoma cruzi]